MPHRDLQSLRSDYEQVAGPITDDLAATLFPLIANRLDEAYAAQPEARIAPTRMVARVAAIVGADLATLSELHWADLLLAERCLAGEAAALRALDDMLSTYVRDVIRSKLSLTQAQVEEVMQLVRVRLLVASEKRPARLASYKAEGKLVAWTRVVALRIALDSVVKPVDEDESLVQAAALDVEDPELRLLCERYGPVLSRALQNAVRLLGERERTLLKFSLVDALSIDEIGAIYNCHRATAARWVNAARASLLAHARAQFSELAQTNDSEFTSIVRVLPSFLDVSLERMLREPAQPAL